jgi:FlaA1/EpsC-like NDP-sugar epimerase
MARHRLLLAIWLLGDLLLFIGLYALAYFLRVGWIFSTDFPFDRFIVITIIVAPMWLAVLTTTRTFGLTRNQKETRNGAYIAYAALVGVALFTLLYYFTYETFFSRHLLALALVLTFTGTWAFHMVFQNIQRILLWRDPPAFPLLIVGVTRESKLLIEELIQHKNPLKPVAILDARGAKEKEINGIPVLGKLNKLEEILQEKGITHLIQCSDLEQSLNLLSACRNRSVTYMLLPSVLGIIERDKRIEALENYPVTVVSPPEGSWTWFFR